MHNYEVPVSSSISQEYFIMRRNLAHIFLIVDASSQLSSDDINAATWCALKMESLADLSSDAS
jgi:GTP-binding protein EngB required for normal cell division